MRYCRVCYGLTSNIYRPISFAENGKRPAASSDEVTSK